MKKIEAFKKDLSGFNQHVQKLLSKAAKQATKAGDAKLARLLEKEKHRLSADVSAFENMFDGLAQEFQKELKKHTRRFEKKIELLQKAKDNLISDNYLLEYKKKDLLLLTQKLEEAYEEISLKNRELVLQQQKISEQAETLNAIHQEILEKNRELEQQKESLLDQSDYLHEANQTITTMHEEVQKQKDEIEKKNEELLSLNNEKNNLIGIVAHDLKSPLNQIKGLLSILKMEANNLNREAASYIEMMEKSAGRLTDMIGKILDVEAIESKNLNLTLETIDLSEVLRQMVDRFSIIADQKSINLQADIKEATSVMLDRSYGDQVFENLISNAIKFSPGGRNISVSLNCNDRRAIVEIKDEGPGLTEDDKKKLFGKYQKLSAKPTGNETSTGLGLSIVKKFVDAMKGEIWCESEAGKGASFFVAFPVVSQETVMNGSVRKF